MLKYNDLAKQLLKNIESSNKFKEFSPSSDSQNMLYLPEQMINIIKNKRCYVISIYFTVKNNKFYLELIFSMKEIIIEISRDEFINYLTLLFYYHIDEVNFTLENNTDEDNDEYVELAKNELLKKVKSTVFHDIFPNW